MVSGRPILVGGNGGVGPLPSIGISSTPLGFAYVYDGKRPDIFVSSDRWYPGFHLYPYVKDAPNGVPMYFLHPLKSMYRNFLSWKIICSRIMRWQVTSLSLQRVKSLESGYGTKEIIIARFDHDGL